MKQDVPVETNLKDKTEISIRFSEVDSIGMVWHGNYVKYLEDGRESFGRKYKLDYFDVFGQGLMTPVVKLNIDYKLQVRYGEQMVIETTYLNCAAAKIIFNYRIFRVPDHALVLTATTIQVFVTREGGLHLTNPEFYLDCKKNNGLVHPTH
jgi:acyl-CoA thioester hydrolase